ncbi:MAG: hypothetical protein ABIW80_04020 [Lapillicoccus sp.]
MQRRIYLPLSAEELRRLGAQGDLAPAPFTAYAVTDDLRRDHPASDEEELEYLAFTDADAAASGEAGAAGEVRLLAAADVDESAVTELLDAGRAVSAVRVSTAVPRRHVVSFHVAEPAQGADGGLPAYAWYDATELDVVLDLLA